MTIVRGVLLIVALAAAPQQALDWDRPVPAEQLDEAVKEVSASLRCPVCQALSVNDSPSELAQQMKELVREQLAGGRTPNEVKAYFEDKYGEFVLLDPKAEGFNLVVYLLPVAMVLAGAVVVVVAVRRWTAPPEVAAADETEGAGGSDEAGEVAGTAGGSA